MNMMTRFRSRKSSNTSESIGNVPLPPDTPFSSRRTKSIRMSSTGNGRWAATGGYGEGERMDPKDLERWESLKKAAESAAIPKQATQPQLYGLNDEQYRQWKCALVAVRQAPNSVEALRPLADKPKLLNWRNPVSGQTLLHEMAARGCSADVFVKASDIGCEASLPNAQGKSAAALAVQRRAGTAQSSNLQLESESPFNSGPQAASKNTRRKAGKKLESNEMSSMPKAKINVDLTWDYDENGEDFDQATVERAIQKSYGGSARVQIDRLEDQRSSSGKRMQNLKCRVMFDNEGEARNWQSRSATSRDVQNNVAKELQLSGNAVEFEKPSEMDEVDAVILKLDSDSSHILCGACLLYDARGQCEKVVCYTDRIGFQGAVRHSGDTKVDGKSVHTISIVQSKIPKHIDQLYFTLCSCGPADLSGFKNPSIMLYAQNEPDANLLEYSINQAKNSVSCVMARMVRQNTWTQEERLHIACALRRIHLPFLCVDLILALGCDDMWAVQALGTEEWNMPEKICGNYSPGKRLIEERCRCGAERQDGQASA